MSCWRWNRVSFWVHSQHTLMRNVNTASCLCSISTTRSHRSLFSSPIKNLEKDCFSIFYSLWTWIAYLLIRFTFILRRKHRWSFNRVKSKVVFSNIFSQSHILDFWTNIICTALKQLRSLLIHKRIFNFQVLVWRRVIKVSKFPWDEFGPIHVFQIFLPSLHFTLDSLSRTLVLHHFFINVSKIMRQ